MLRHVFSGLSETMDHVVPRSPQNGECFHDDDLACNTGTSPTAPVATSAAIEGQFDAPPAGTASPASYPSSPPSQQTGSIIGPVTSTPTIYNDNGSSYTLLTTTYPTTALLTTSTTPASSAPPISTALPLVTLSPETPYANADSNSDSGLSKAAVAGLAIGTTFLGALIAFLTAWLLFKRRDRDRGFVRLPRAGRHAAENRLGRAACACRPESVRARRRRRAHVCIHAPTQTDAAIWRCVGG